MAHSDVRIGKRQIEGVITRRSDEQLGLEKGDKVKVMIIENCDCRVLAAPTTVEKRQSAVTSTGGVVRWAH